MQFSDKSTFLAVSFMIVISACLFTPFIVKAASQHDISEASLYDQYTDGTVDSLVHDYVDEELQAELASKEINEESAHEDVNANYSSEGKSVLTAAGGVNYYNGNMETWYSQRVLPGGGLDIPGRHVAEDGTIRDVDGYIVVASDNYGYGTVVETSLGLGKVYDTGVGHDGWDIYVDWG